MTPSGLVWIFVIYFLLTSPAYAYIDPGLGSMLLQGLLAVVVAVAAFWHRARQAVITLFKRVVSKGGHQAEDTHDRAS